jgi:hypothetical protein
MQAYWKMSKYGYFKRMDAEHNELFPSNFISQFYLGKLKKGTVFNENHEDNILVVLNREIFCSVGNTGNFKHLVGNYCKLSIWISYSNYT